MARRSLLVVVCFSVALTTFGARAASAQSGSGFTGVVKDSTGGVLPGVTVEAASPALIEKVKTAVTDASGAYRIIDLRPGVYSLTFTLPGFSVSKREGIELPAEFTATINTELKPGTLEETITVTGGAPLIDTTNVLQQNIIKSDLVELLPASSRSPQAIALLTPGVTTVFGSLPGNFPELQTTVHGGDYHDQQISINGDTAVFTGGTGAGSSNMRWNEALIQEMTVKTGGAGADQEAGGMVTNIIPKEGGNAFSGSLVGTYTTKRLTWNNLSAGQITGGLTAVNGVVHLHDFTPAIGGPIKKDKIWFFASARAFKSTQSVAGMYNSVDPKAWVWTPDVSRPALTGVLIPDVNGRVTWQMTQSNKMSFFVEDNGYAQFGRSVTSTATMEAGQTTSQRPNTFGQVNWKSTRSSKLLLEGNLSTYSLTGTYKPEGGADYTSVSAVEQTTGLRFHGPALIYGGYKTKNFTPRVTATYVTGAHNLQTGFSWEYGTRVETRFNAGGYEMRLNRGVPNRLTEFATPIVTPSNLNAQVALYGQDQWRIGRRLTLNYGLRYDKLVAEILPDVIAQGDIVGPRSFAGVKNAPNYTDVSPRLGFAFDPFGNAKTAVKGFLGRYVARTSVATQLAPINRSVTSVTRTWTDNGNFIPDCDLKNPLANSAGGDTCGQIDNLNFGQNNPNATQIDPETTQGFGKRTYNWYGSMELQQQLSTTASVTFGYYRRWYGNFTTVNDNLAVTSADYDPYCVKAPLDPRLPGGGGYQVCGLYDIKADKFGQGISRTVPASTFGDQTSVYNGFDVNGNIRIKGGIGLNGGMNIGRTVNNNCFVVDSPQALLNCKTKPPMQPNARLVISYAPPKWGLQFSSSFLMNPPPEITASYTASQAEITGLNRPLSAGATATVTVPLVAPGTMFGQYVKQMDLRMAKRWRLAGKSYRASMDVFNLFNSNTPQGLNTTFGPQWQQPTSILLGRYVQFSGQWDF